MKGFVGIGRADHVETAITEATAGLKKADFLILIAPFSKIEAAAALLGEKYPGTPMIGTSGEGIAKEMGLTQAIIVIGFAGIEVCTGIIEDVRNALRCFAGHGLVRRIIYVIARILGTNVNPVIPVLINDHQRVFIGSQQ